MLKNNKTIIYALGAGLFILAAVIFGGAGLANLESNVEINNEQEAIDYLFEKVPELQNLTLSQSIFSQEIEGNWYIAVAYSTSTVRFINADCFRISSGGDIDRIGFRRETLEINRINPITCRGE